MRTLASFMGFGLLAFGCTALTDFPRVATTPDAGPIDAAVPVPVCDGCAPGTAFCDLPGKNTDLITVPEGFCAREFYAPRIIEARVIRFAPNGDLFLAAPSMATPGGAAQGPGAILVLPDDNRDGVADTALTFAGGSPATADCKSIEGDPNNLACVHGLTFAGDYLYFTRSDEVRRVRYSKGDRKAAGASEVVASLGGSSITEVRWTHTLDVGNDGRLYVSRGRFESSGVCSALQMSYGAVFALDPTKPLPVPTDLVADGFRNPMYLRFGARPNALYAAELSGDSWGGIGGREKLAVVQPGGRWGYPCCVGKDMPAPGSTESCNDIGQELLSIPLNDTPFGMDFEPGNFPAPYTKGLFVALHGAFGQPWKGTALSWMPTDANGRPMGPVTEFATGWSSNFPGRATDVAFAPDGRMFVIDDTQGRIFWIAPKTLKMQ